VLLFLLLLPPSFLFLILHVDSKILVDLDDLRLKRFFLRNLKFLSLVGFKFFFFNLLDELLDLIQLLVAVADLLSQVLLERAQL
jgi:hypothetical protein